jgi:O-succinylbenzoate synthase
MALMDAMLELAWRPFAFRLPRQLVTAQGALAQKRGWLLRLQTADGRLGWGEAAPLEPQDPQGHGACAAAIAALGPRLERQHLEQALPQLPGPLAFAFGLALAELEGLGSPGQGGWLAAPPSAELLPAGAAALTALEALLQERPPCQGIGPLTVKWKVAAGADAEERAVLEQLLARLPAGCKLRLDANGGWDQATAQAWAERLAGDPRLDWLEQPLSVADPQGLEQLAALVPVALDESLMADPALAQRWRGWQVRRPASEGDPRPLLAALQAGTPNLCLSTALETGIGRRLLAHLAALQAQGPTPTAPGLAPGWRPQGELFAADPERVWGAVG